jgi:D-lactate dehydrogenase
MKIYVFSAHPYEIPFLEEAAKDRHILFLTEKKLSVETASMVSGCRAISIFTSDDASAPVLEQLKSCGVEFIALRSSGHDHIDLIKAEELGIAVANVPAYSPYAIAEHAVALLLTLNRKIIEGQMRMRTRDFRLDDLVGFDIHGKTVGIIGTGAIGTAFAKIMKGFGATVLGYDPAWSLEAVESGIYYVSMNELLKNSDIISIHCPLNENTRYLISSPSIERMKKGCIVINTARGGVVNTNDLIDALELGKIGGACLDVYEYEKPLFFTNHRSSSYHDPLFSRLTSLPNVVVTGHQGFLTNEALQGIATTTVKNLDCWEFGNAHTNSRNPRPCMLNSCV